jgi:hypothetical protein
MFSLFMLVPPQHEADNDAEREGGSERRDRPLRDDAFEISFVLAQGLAEVVQCNLDLFGESLGAIFGGVEDALAGGVQ